jgi:hypothetical protein
MQNVYRNPLAVGTAGVATLLSSLFAGCDGESAAQRAVSTPTQANAERYTATPQPEMGGYDVAISSNGKWTKGTFDYPNGPQRTKCTSSSPLEPYQLEEIVHIVDREVTPLENDMLPEGSEVIARYNSVGDGKMLILYIPFPHAEPIESEPLDIDPNNNPFDKYTQDQSRCSRH